MTAPLFCLIVAFGCVVTLAAVGFTLCWWMLKDI